MAGGFTGKLWDAWLSLCTLRVSEVPSHLASEEALTEFLTDEERGGLPGLQLSTTSIVHGWSAIRGTVEADTLLAFAGLEDVQRVLEADLIWSEQKEGGFVERMQVSLSDACWEITDVNDTFIEDARVRRLRQRCHAKRPKPASPPPTAQSPTNEGHLFEQASRQHGGFAEKMEAWEVQMVLADSCMKASDYYHAKWHYRQVLEDKDVKEGGAVHKKATNNFALAQKRYAFERKRVREEAQRRAKSGKGEWAAKLAAEKRDHGKIEELAAGYRQRRDQRMRAARETFRSTKKQQNMANMASGVASLAGALDGKTTVLPAIKWGVGKKKRTLALSNVLGGSGVGQLLRVSDGRVLRSVTKQSEWQLAHDSVSETIRRAREEMEDFVRLGDKVNAIRGYHVRNHNVPQTRAEVLSFKMAKLRKRGPANVAPRPDNQFGSQCVVPAFTQIEQIATVVNTVEGLLEEAKANEIRLAEQKDHAILTVQSLARAKQARKIVDELRAEQEERDRLAALERQREEEARLAEQARLAAESPTTKNCRLMFNEMDEDGSGELDRDEIKLLARRLGKRLSKSELDAAMAEMDADGSGEVDFDEFVSWWKEIGSKNKGFLSGFLSRFSFSALRQKRIQEKHASEGLGLGTEMQPETYVDEAGQLHMHKTMMQVREEAEAAAQVDTERSIAAAKRIQTQSRSHLVDSELGAVTFDTAALQSSEHLHIASTFDSFALGGDRDRGRSLRERRAVREANATTLLGDAMGRRPVPPSS
jgi:hypothetical protein